MPGKKGKCPKGFRIKQLPQLVFVGGTKFLRKQMRAALLSKNGQVVLNQGRQDGASFLANISREKAQMSAKRLLAAFSAVSDAKPPGLQIQRN
jgi:hypothetical protein